MNEMLFVMLTTQNGSAVPLTENGEMKFFATIEDAERAALSTVFGGEFGYEVFELGGGVLTV